MVLGTVSMAWSAWIVGLGVRAIRTVPMAAGPIDAAHTAYALIDAASLDLRRAPAHGHRSCRWRSVVPWLVGRSWSR